MCGCHAVTFRFAETFSPDSAYKPHPAHRSTGVELALLLEDSPGKISIQHLLVVDDTGVVKHWRQDWTWQPAGQYRYDRDNRWRYQTLDQAKAKGAWKQQVFQVDDGPRYEATARFVHADGRHYWESTADSPLPRREFTTRSDYNVLRRRNRHEMLPQGWVHEQDNDKLLRSTQGDSLIASEKGYNDYVRISESRCKAAVDYWKKHEAYWTRVRSIWSRYYERGQDFSLARAVDNKPLFQHLFALPPTATEAEIQAVLTRFYKPETSAEKATGMR